MLFRKTSKAFGSCLTIPGLNLLLSEKMETSGQNKLHLKVGSNLVDKMSLIKISRFFVDSTVSFQYEVKKNVSK